LGGNRGQTPHQRFLLASAVSAPTGKETGEDFPMRNLISLQKPRKRRQTMSSLLLVLPIVGLVAIFGMAIRHDRGGEAADYPTLQDLI